MSTLSNEGADVLAAAAAWWRARRPLSYSRKQHIANPTVNCATAPEKDLAVMVARYIRARPPIGADEYDV